MCEEEYFETILVSVHEILLFLLLKEDYFKEVKPSMNKNKKLVEIMRF